MVIDIIDVLTHDYLRGAVFLVPVNIEKVETHAEDAVEDLQTVEYFLDSLVVGVVVDLVLVFVALAWVLEHPLKVTVIDHGHRTVPIRIPTISVELMHRILQPSVALLFQDVSVHEDVVEHNANLEKLKGVEQLAAIEFLFLENKHAFDEDSKRSEDRLSD